MFIVDNEKLFSTLLNRVKFSFKFISLKILIRFVFLFPLVLNKTLEILLSIIKNFIMNYLHELFKLHSQIVPTLYLPQQNLSFLKIIMLTIG